MTDKVDITIQQGQRTFFYSGIILSEDNHFLTVEDRKLGTVRLNKAMVISIRPHQKRNDTR